MKDKTLLLDEAADLVNEVLARLDSSETNCDHCKLVRKNNMDEFRASQELFAAMKKLEKWSEFFASREKRHNPRSTT